MARGMAREAVRKGAEGTCRDGEQGRVRVFGVVGSRHRGWYG